MDSDIVIVCVNAQNYLGRGAQYVNILCDMIGRNLPDTVAFDFVCLTDNPDGLNPAIRTLPLPDGVKGWWNKLYMFKEGLFPDNKQIFYFDLDTCIVGNIAPLIAYRGELATLRDFYHPERVGPAIISWRSNSHAELWESFDRDVVTPQENDLTWINAYLAKYAITPVILQDVFKQEIVSYKVDAQHALPRKARIVCFHGLPRPHECAGWVAKIWMIGGQSVADYVLSCNTDDSVLEAQIMHNASRNIPAIGWHKIHETKGIIVGGGPSLEQDLTWLRMLAEQGAHIFAINGALEYLLTHKVPVKALVMLDARKENLKFVKKKRKVDYYLAAQVHPSVFDHLEGRNVKLFYPNAPGLYDKLVNMQKTDAALIGGGRTAGLMAMGLLYTMGFRDIELFGMDSSYVNKNHAYKQPMNDKDNVVEIEYNGVQFTSSPWMVQQVDDFMPLAEILVSYGCRIAVHGDGLLPAVANSMVIEEKACA